MTRRMFLPPRGLVAAIAAAAGCARNAARIERPSVARPSHQSPAVTSLFGGFATSQAYLVAARSLHGAGAALLTPTTLAIIAAAFPDLKERAQAIGIWAATSALAFAVGPLTGGAIAQHIHWSWIFWINVPVGIVGWLIGRTVIDESRDETATRRIDLAGLALSGATLLASATGSKPHHSAQTPHESAPSSRSW